MSIDFTPEEFAIIDDYLHNELKGEELQDFEKKLSSDPELQAKVRELNLTELAIGETALESELNAFYAERNIEKYQQEKKRGKKFSFKFIAIAASFAIIIGLSLYFTLFQKQQTLYARYYKPDPGLMTAMSYSDHYEFQKAMVEFKNANYTSAINIWQLQLKVTPNKDTLLYFLGAAYQAKGNIDSAENYLQKVAIDSKSAFYNDANWYLGLIYLRKSQKEQAIEYLKKSNHTKKETLIPLIEK